MLSPKTFNNAPQTLPQPIEPIELMEPMEPMEPREPREPMEPMVLFLGSPCIQIMTLHEILNKNLILNL